MMPVRNFKLKSDKLNAVGTSIRRLEVCQT
jgi:hypothetical protein